MLAARSYDWTDAVVQLLNAPFRYPAVWLPTAFLLGACVGSLLNVCILRLPRGRSLLWPGSTCGACFQRILWRDNIPLLSYWLLRGRCRYCGAGFASLYFWIELLTAASFAGLWCAEVVFNVRAVGAPFGGGRQHTDSTDLAIIWLYHVILVSLLIVVVATTMHGAAVSRNLFRFGMFVGILGAAVCPWPWPANASTWTAPTPLTFFGQVREAEFTLIPSGLQPWPLGLPALEALRETPAVHGLLTALAGALVGPVYALLQAGPAGTASRARQRENALLIMMIGVFIGWQGAVLVVILAGGLQVLKLRLEKLGTGIARLPFCLSMAVATVLVLTGSGQVSLLVQRVCHLATAAQGGVIATDG